MAKECKSLAVLGLGQVGQVGGRGQDLHLRF